MYNCATATIGIARIATSLTRFTTPLMMLGFALLQCPARKKFHDRSTGTNGKIQMNKFAVYPQVTTTMTVQVAQ